MITINTLSIAGLWGSVWPYLVAVLLFLFLIFIHELGHFLVAKATGVKVNEFAVGFGPAIFKWQGKETLYAIRIIPFGGYCAMEGEDENSQEPRAFCNAAAWKRFLIIIAGAIFNLIFGFILVLSITISNQTIVSTVIGGFKETATSNSSGLMADDQIVNVDGRGISSVYDLSYCFTNIEQDGKLDITVKRNGEKVQLKDVSFATVSENGVNYVSVDFYCYSIEKTVGSVLVQSFKQTVSYGKIVWWSLIDLLTGKYGVSAVSGPVGVAQAMGEAASNGLSILLPMLALITINLGVFNLLPVPALDGSRALFIIIEMILKLFGKGPIPKNKEAIVHAIGLAVLLGFIALVTVKDIFALF